MAKTAILSVRVVTDAKEGKRALNDYTKSVADLDGTLKKASSPMTAVKSLISGVGKVAGGVAKTVGGLAIATAALAIKGGIAKSLQIENATAKMKGLKHSTQTVSAVMDDALASVKGTAFGLGDAADVASTAMASGIKPGQEMRKYLTLVADAAATAQIPLGEMGQIMGKVTNSGKVTNDVLDQFGSRGVGALQMLADHYGVTAGEMTKMVSKGKVDAATFNEVLQKNIGGAALASGDTTKGAFANMRSALSNFGIVLSGWFFPHVKTVFNQLQKVFEGLTDRFKPISDALTVTFAEKAGPILATFGDKTLKVLDEVMGGFTAFVAAWKANDGDVTSSGFPGFMERVANAARVVQGIFKKLDFSSFQGFLASIPGAGGAAAPMFESIGRSLKTLAPAAQAFMNQAPKITGALVKLGGVSLNLLTMGLAFLADHVDTIIKFMPVLVAGFVAWRIASGAMATNQMRINALQVAAVPLTTVNNVLRLVAIRQETQLATATGARTVATQQGLLAMAREKVVMVARGAMMVAQKTAMGVAIAAQWAWNAAISANPIMLIVLGVAALVAGIILAYNKIGWFKDFVDAAFKFIKDAVAKVVDFFGTAWNVAVTLVSGYIKKWQLTAAVVFTVLRAAVAKVVDFFGTAWNVAVTLVSGYIKKWQLTAAVVFAVLRAAVSAVADFFGTAWNVAVTLVTAYIQGWQNVIGAIFGAVQWAISGVADFFGSVWSGAVAVATGVIWGFETGVANIFGFVRRTIDTAISLVRDTLAGAFTTAADFATSAFDRIRSAIENVIGWVRSAIDWVGSLFGATNNAKGAATGLGGGTGYYPGPHGGPDFPGGATGFSGFAAPFAPRSAPAGNVTYITVEVKADATSDPVAIGRAIEKALATYRKTVPA